MKKTLLNLSFVIISLIQANSFAQTVSTISQTIETPSGVAVDASGNVYFAERSPGSRITKLNQSTGTSTTFSNSGITDPMDIEFGTNNDLFVADYGGNSILRIPTTGGSATNYLTGANGPAGIVFDGDTLYFIEYVSQIVYKVLPGGGAVGSANVIQINDSASWMLCASERGTGLEMLANGNLFVTSALCYASYEIDKETGSIVNAINSVEAHHLVQLDSQTTTFIYLVFTVTKFLNGISILLMILLFWVMALQIQ